MFTGFQIWFPALVTFFSAGCMFQSLPECISSVFCSCPSTAMVCSPGTVSQHIFRVHDLPRALDIPRLLLIVRPC